MRSDGFAACDCVGIKTEIPNANATAALTSDFFMSTFLNYVFGQIYPTLEGM
jgi:hypothetical protein